MQADKLMWLGSAVAQFRNAAGTPRFCIGLLLEG